MVNEHENLESLFEDIADSIRAKDGSSEEIIADTFPEKIQAIPQGIFPSGSVDITENGTHDVADYAIANVNVPSEEAWIYPNDGNRIVRIADGTTRIRQSSQGGLDGYGHIDKLYFPASIDTIDMYAFRNCFIKNFYVESVSKYLSIIGFYNYVLYAANNSSSTYERYIYDYNGNEIVDIVVPNNVTRIEGKVCPQCHNVRSLTLPTGLTYIGGEGGFIYTNISYIKIPSTVTEIGGYAFRWMGLTPCTYDFTEFELVNGALPITFGVNVFQAILANSRILFATKEIADVAKTTTNLSSFANYIHYIGEEQAV